MLRGADCFYICCMNAHVNQHVFPTNQILLHQNVRMRMNNEHNTTSAGKKKTFQVSHAMMKRKKGHNDKIRNSSHQSRPIYRILWKALHRARIN